MTDKEIKTINDKLTQIANQLTQIKNEQYQQRTRHNQLLSKLDNEFGQVKLKIHNISIR